MPDCTCPANWHSTHVEHFPFPTWDEVTEAVRHINTSASPVRVSTLLYCDCTCHQPIGPSYHDSGVHSCLHCQIIG